VKEGELTLKAGNVVFSVPRSMFQGDVNGVVVVDGKEVPAKVIYAAWALGVDQGAKAGAVLGAGGTLLLVLLVLAVRAWLSRRGLKPASAGR